MKKTPRLLSLEDLALARGGEDPPKTLAPPPPKPKDQPYLVIKLENVLIS